MSRNLGENESISILVLIMVGKMVTLVGVSTRTPPMGQAFGTLCGDNLDLIEHLFMGEYLLMVVLFVVESRMLIFFFGDETDMDVFLCMLFLSTILYIGEAHGALFVEKRRTVILKKGLCPVNSFCHKMTENFVRNIQSVLLSRNIRVKVTRK